MAPAPTSTPGASGASGASRANGDAAASGPHRTEAHPIQTNHRLVASSIIDTGRRRREVAVPVSTSGSVPRLRASRYGWSTVVLVAVAVLLLVWELFLLSATTGDLGQRPVLLPLDVRVAYPGGALLAAVTLLVLATFVGLAALQTSAAMQILSPDRTIPPPPPPAVRRARRLMLGPFEEDLISAEHPTDLPPIALPARAELPAGATIRCTVLVPAHNEEPVLGHTLTSLAEQTRSPDRIVVIADNCTDATADVARRHGVDVVETVGNTEKKAGALNQALEHQVLPAAEWRDVVLVMDADSTLSASFLEVALGLLEDDPDLIAVGGLFYGEDGGRLVGQFQRNEYGRYQRLVARKLGRVFVLTGTASVIRSYALRAVAQARGTLIPGPVGKVYDTHALTEDNELTLALKSLGARMTSPPECRVTTEIMTSWRHLWRQRLRWHRGALENIGDYGLTRATALYWGQQLGLAYGVLALQSYFLLMTVSLLAADAIRWSPFWLGIGAIFVLERLVTVWRVGWRARAVAAPVFLELAYTTFLQACFVTSMVQILLRRKADWNYVQQPSASGLLTPGLMAWLVAWGILLPASILRTDWYEALCLWVGFNTLVFAGLSVLHLLPPARHSPTVTSEPVR